MMRCHFHKIRVGMLAVVLGLLIYVASLAQENAQAPSGPSREFPRGNAGRACRVSDSGAQSRQRRSAGQRHPGVGSRRPAIHKK